VIVVGGGVCQDRLCEQLFGLLFGRRLFTARHEALDCEGAPKAVAEEACASSGIAAAASRRALFLERLYNKKIGLDVAYKGS